jgi:mannose-6-phosphate isomerase-like protein (cupin superfamily)
MFHILHPQDRPAGTVAKVAFEGASYRAGVSFFQGELPPGKGPGLHRHPYSETCIVLAGRAAMVVDGREVAAGAGDIVVIEPATPHRFTAVGDERLAMVCVHASDRFIIEGLGDAR